MTRWYEMQLVGVNVKLVEPGVINTDFIGRSFDFSNDETLAEYQGLVGKFFAGKEAMSEFASSPSTVSAGHLSCGHRWQPTASLHRRRGRRADVGSSKVH